MKFLNWLLYQSHRWLGVVLGIFMFVWITSGLVIMYSTPTTQTRSQQLAHAEPLLPDSNWLSLGEVWQRSAEQRQALVDVQQSNGHGAAEKANPAPATILDARLQRIAGEPLWLVEDSRGKRFALSALDGSLKNISVEQALTIAQHWAKAQGLNDPLEFAHLETVDAPIILRNQDALKPFHRVGFGGESYELLISSRTGEVLHASTAFNRAFYWAGNWIHTFKPLTSLGLEHQRHLIQQWAGGLAAIACLTGLIIGWLRWRPGFGGKRTYSEGRTQPYREFWAKWHFWTGLIGGSLALFWASSGFLETNPAHLFSSPDVSKVEQARYLGAELPDLVANWQPTLKYSAIEGSELVELTWKRVANEAVLLAYTQKGERWPQALSGASAKITETALLTGIQRLSANTAVANQQLLSDYDSYYYPRHHQTLVERPLPVLKVELADEAGTRFYIDPQDGRILAKLDRSRRLFRWVYSALHHWDFGWLYYRPIWDLWMLTWIGFGIVLGASSLVLGWRRLKLTFVPKKKPVKVARAKSQLLPD